MWIHREYRRAGVTLELLHEEYLQAHPSGFSYTTFCVGTVLGFRAAGCRCGKRTAPATRSSSTTCHGSAYEIGFGSAKRIGLRSAKRIGLGSAMQTALVTEYY